MNNYNQRFNPRQQNNKDDCKIKLKQTKTGTELIISGNCTKEHIEVAKAQFGDKLKIKQEESY